jgi:hypothetical protein
MTPRLIILLKSTVTIFYAKMARKSKVACDCKKEIKVFVLAAWLEDPSFRVFPFSRLEAIRTAAQAEKVMHMEGGKSINITSDKW